MKKFLLFILLVFMAQAALFAGGQAEASADRGSYLAGLGQVIPPDDIHIDSYINQSDYDYPFPQAGALGIITAAGYNDNGVYLLAGLRGRREDFSALPPMNLSFVIDISGSMSSQNKMDWVKESLHIFIERVRPQDYVSLVVFDNVAELLMKPVNIRTQADRDHFRQVVNSLRPRGSTNIYAGMEMGFAQAQENLRPDYNNRVILLTDGMDNASRRTRKEFLDMAELFKDQGINISTISLGAEADINLMVDVAIAGGGSSRFISNRTVMEQTFGSELDRLVVAAARNLRMEIALSEGITYRETWGYSFWVSGNTIHFTQDTLHNGDYETILVEVAAERPLAPGTVLGNFFISYDDVSGAGHREGPIPIILGREPGGLMADARVREAEGFLVLARGLIEIGNRAPELTGLQQEFSRLRSEAIRAARENSEPGSEVSQITDSPETAALRLNIIQGLDEILGIVESLSTYLNTINDSLGGGKYEAELGILQNYRNSFTRSRNEYSQENP